MSDKELWCQYFLECKQDGMADEDARKAADCFLADEQAAFADLRMLEMFGGKQ